MRVFLIAATSNTSNVLKRLSKTRLGGIVS